MNTNQKYSLVLEALEKRCLLSGFWQGVDVDGDAVMVKLTGPGDLAILTEVQGVGEEIQVIAVSNTTRSSKLTVNALQMEGDGYVDVGSVDAAGETLKRITIDGYLGDLRAARINKLALEGNLVSYDNETEWSINGKVKKIHVYDSLEELTVRIGGEVKKIIVEGNVSSATFLLDSRLRKMNVYGDLDSDSLIYALDKINKIAVFGALDQSEIRSGGQLKRLYVGRDLTNSIVQADGSINNIVVDGSIEGTVIETAGRIRVIDVWDWIIDSTVVAGARGINAIYSYNMSNTTIDTPGNIGYIHLDAYARYEPWDDLIIVEEDAWYWPVYDAEYIEVVYLEGYPQYYYVDDYWDVYYDDYYYRDIYYSDIYIGDDYYIDDYYGDVCCDGIYGYEYDPYTDITYEYDSGWYFGFDISW